MSSYRLLFNLSVEHDFFAGGPCPVLDFVPARESTVTAANTSLLIRSTSNGVRVYYDQDNVEALALCAAEAGEPLRLTFKAFARDYCFYNYTAPTCYREDSVLFLHNREPVVDDDDRRRLHRAEHVSDLNFERLDSPRIAGLVDGEDRGKRLVCIVEIGISGQACPSFSGQSDAVPDYYMRFDARRTVWKYYFLGQTARKNACIAGSDEGVEFEYTGREVLADGQTASTFRSKKPLPLHNRPDLRFHLRDAASGNGKIFIKRLPVASAARLHRETVDGKEVLISEIYVNY